MGGRSLTLRTKLRPPQVRDGFIDRPDLLQRLRDGRGRSLTLVCAPAGYGKTTLLAQWHSADRKTTPFVWISLDERDSDPIRLWTDLVSGVLETLQEEPGAIAAPTSASSITDVALPGLVATLDDAQPLVVVLDDWHLVRNPVCDRTVGTLVERAPAHAQFVVASRSEPGLPVARLRAQGKLAEVRAVDLKVTGAQAAELFRNAGIAITKRDLHRITARTEGWLAALSLALLVLKEHEDPRHFVREFSGDTQHVFEYLARDVLDATDPDTREFLVRSSVLDRLSAPLCDAVLERSDSAAKLADVERSNLFLVPLDSSGAEYRYHHLFEAVLRRELAASDTASVQAFHVRASHWYEEHDDIERAVEHAISAHDLARSSALGTIAAVPLLSVGRMATVNRWFGELSWPEAQADRQLAAVRALAAGLSGEGRDAIERWLRVAEDGPDVGPLANGVTSTRSIVAMISSIYLSRGIEDAIAASTLVLETEPLGSEWRYAGLVPLGQALYLAGRGDEARKPLDEARRLPHARQRATTLIALSYLSLIALADGAVEDARTLAEHALELAEQLGHASSAGAATPHLALGCVLMQGADLLRAIEHLERSAHLAGDEAPSYWRAHALVHLAAARHRLGDDDGARDALAQARAGLAELPDAGVLGELCDDTERALRHHARRESFRGQDLSEAESRVLHRLVDGYSVSQVAHELWLSSNTVKTHRRNIYRKLGAANRDELVVRAHETGFAPRVPVEVHPG